MSQTEGEREHLQRIRKEAIKLGLIDLGPQVVHTTVTKDTRDLRDPHILGETLFLWRRNNEHLFGGKGLSKIADEVPNAIVIPDYRHDESNVQTTIDTYRQKMQEQAAKGDVYALRVLLDKAWALPHDIDQDLLARAQEMHSADDEVIE